jgi:threonine/homoserine/homoserine lactone efflux protein
VLALALLTVLPGPDVAVVTRLALSNGRAEAVRGSLGIVSGLLVWGLLTVAGLAALLAASATAYTVVKVVGAAYLVFLGVQAIWQSRTVEGAPTADTPATGVARGFRVGFVSNLLNPKIAVFYTGLLPNLVPLGAPHGVTLVGLVLVHCLLSLAWLTLYTAFLLRASGVLGRPSVRQTLERVTGVVLIGFGVRVALAGRR